MRIFIYELLNCVDECDCTTLNQGNFFFFWVVSDKTSRRHLWELLEFTFFKRSVCKFFKFTFSFYVSRFTMSKTLSHTSCILKYFMIRIGELANLFEIPLQILLEWHSFLYFRPFANCSINYQVFFHWFQYNGNVDNFLGGC